MKKNYLKFCYSLVLCLLSGLAFGQSSSWNNPDSATNISKPGIAWGITNPIGVNHDSMQHSPYNFGIPDSTDYLYMHDFGFNIPATATIEGVELIISRGGCNAGAYFRDTVQLAYNSAPMGFTYNDSTGPSGAVDTFGAPNDVWYCPLTPAMVNSGSFGIFYSARSFGICTFGVFDCKLKVHYSMPTGLEGVATSKSINVYPNPASTEVVIDSRELPAGSGYSIRDAMGRIVAQGTVNGAQTTVNIQALPAGIYAIQLADAISRFVKK